MNNLLDAAVVMVNLHTHRSWLSEEPSTAFLKAKEQFLELVAHNENMSELESVMQYNLENNYTIGIDVMLIVFDRAIELGDNSTNMLLLYSYFLTTHYPEGSDEDLLAQKLSSELSKRYNHSIK